MPLCSVTASCSALMLLWLYVITVDTCAVACGYLQAAVLLFAMVGGGVLHTFYVEVSAVRPDVFADHLHTSE